MTIAAQHPHEPMPGRWTSPPRLRTLSDEQVLERVGAALGQSGSAWTLAGAAAVAGLHPATLIKRSGSRHGLLVALSRR